MTYTPINCAGVFGYQVYDEITNSVKLVTLDGQPLVAVEYSAIDTPLPDVLPVVTF